MPDYNEILSLCKSNNQLSRTVLDEFLVYYAASRNSFDKEFDNKIARYKEPLREMPAAWKGLAKSQYIAHRVFRKNGEIHKYLKHAAIKQLAKNQQDYLHKQAACPWRFSFSEIIAKPAPDFYEMQDVFTGETYLLHSVSITQNLSERAVLLWFNLIGFNGSCWQTFGPVIYFRSFSTDDIFFYATELNPSIESDDDLVNDVDENPVLYMLLALGSEYPLVQSRGYEIIQTYGHNQQEVFDLQKLKPDFTVEYAASVYKLTHATWSLPPYTAQAFYSENKEIISLTALTDKGYEEMARILQRHKINIPEEPDIRIHISLLTLLQKIAKKKILLNEYESLFETKQSPASEAALDKLNEFLALALPYVNAGREPDVEMLARQAGVDPEAARQVLETARAGVRNMLKR